VGKFWGEPKKDMLGREMGREDDLRYQSASFVKLPW